MINIIARTMAFALFAASSVHATPCDNRTPGIDHFYGAGWGIDKGNQRYQSQTSIDAGNARNLTLKWSYGFSSRSPRVFPLVSEDTIFIGDGGHGVVALARDTGCVRWENTDIDDAATGIAHGQLDGRTVLVLSGRNSGVFALDAITGETLWHATLDHDNPVPMYSGSPLVHDNQVFVPLSSLEIGLSANPFYGCCTTSGAMAALDLATGALNWYHRTIPDAPEKTGSHFVFVDHYGPSGAPVWGAPTLDEKRRQIYFGTGQNYSRPASATSDAIIALDIDTGEVAWIMQATEGDAFNMSCGGGTHPNCPEPMGPDVDFGAPPILTTRSDGTDVVLAGQKSGDIWAIHPDTGAVLWQTRIGRGGALGGVHWGMALNPDEGVLYAPISDVPAIEGPDEPEPGLFALSIDTGKPIWSTPRVKRCEGRGCWPGLSAAITAAPGIVVAGSLDGMLEVYAASTGQLLWSFDGLIDYDTTNALEAHGGSFDSHGPLLAGHQLIAVSGYGSFRQKPGNALLVFEVADGTVDE